MTELVASGVTLQLLKDLSALHGALSQHEIFDALESLLTQVGRGDFSLVSAPQPEASLLFSTRLKGARSRLNSPIVDNDQFLELIGSSSEETISPQGAGAFVVEGEEIPTSQIWHLRVGSESCGYVIFHSPIQPDEDLNFVADEIRRNASVSFFKLLDHERSQEQVELFQTKIEAINEVGEMLGSLDIEILLTKLMELALYVASGQVGSILLHDKDSDDIDSRVEWGLPLEMARSFCDREGRVVYETVLEQGKPVLILDFGDNNEYHIYGFDLRVDSYLCIPLISKNGVLGCINLVNSTQDGTGFSELDREILMTISGLAATSIENALLHVDSLEKERYQQSLSIARDIQKSFYPAEAPAIEGLDVGWQTESCDETGGDYFDFMVHEDGALTVAVGDVSGHGIGAALLMAAARASLRASFAHDEDLSTVMARLNDQLEQDMEQERFMTLTVMTIPMDERAVKFVNAGHDAPCIFRAADHQVEELGATGMPLGLFSGMAFGTGEVPHVRPGDIVLFTTDGVWEVHNSAGEMLGKDRLTTMFQEHCLLPDVTAQSIAMGILKEVEEFTGPVPARDDVTIVVVRVKDPQ